MGRHPAGDGASAHGPDAGSEQGGLGWPGPSRDAGGLGWPVEDSADLAPAAAEPAPARAA